jgi:hypothetical protein
MLRDGLTERHPAVGQMKNTTRIQITTRGRARLAEQHGGLF